MQRGKPLLCCRSEIIHVCTLIKCMGGQPGTIINASIRWEFWGNGYSPVNFVFVKRNETTVEGLGREGTVHLRHDEDDDDTNEGDPRCPPIPNFGVSGTEHR